MLKNGFVKINRSIIDWRWYKEPLTAMVFLHLILTANYDDKDFRNFTVKRGQRVLSYATLAEEMGLSIQNVRTALKHLLSTGEVTKFSQGKFTVISVTNYDEYQMNGSNSNILSTPSQQPSNNDGRKIKKDKEREEDEEERRNASSSISEVTELYSRICKSLPAPDITGDTEANIRIAINFYGMDKIRTAFQTVENTPFLSGKVKDWCADINWIFANGNIDKILNGKYREYKPKQENDEFDADKYAFVINQF